MSRENKSSAVKLSIFAASLCVFYIFYKLDVLKGAGVRAATRKNKRACLHYTKECKTNIRSYDHFKHLAGCARDKLRLHPVGAGGAPPCKEGWPGEY